MTKESYGTRRSKILREKVLSRYGGKCVKCGFNDQRALQVDHVKGCGKENRIQGAIQRMTHMLKDQTGMYQLLCANCNWIKKSENKEIGNRFPNNHTPKRFAATNQTNGPTV